MKIPEDFFRQVAAEMMDDYGKTRWRTLPNGIRVVFRQTDTYTDVIRLGVMVGTGTRDEQPEENGMAHYIEHCVFKGTQHHTARQIIDTVEGVGGEINAYTTKEETVFYATTLSSHIPSTLHLLAEMVKEPTFPKEETDKECTVIGDEIESYNDSPSDLIYDDFENMLFRGHSLAMPILGTKKTLRHISSTPEKPLQWMQRHYDPRRMVVFAQGDYPYYRLLSAMEREFGSIPVPETPFMRMLPPELPAAQVTYKRHTHQQHVMIGGLAYPLGHALQLPLYLLNNIMGGGSLNSRLNLSLREKQGLVYTIESTYTPLSDTGYWCTYFACEPEHTERCLALVREELAKAAAKPISAAALRKALTQLHGQMAIADENKENSVLAMAKHILYFNEAPYWEETFEKISETTPAQLLQVAQEIFAPKNLSVLIYE